MDIDLTFMMGQIPRFIDAAIVTMKVGVTVIITSLIVLDVMLSLAKEGMTMMIVTHEMSFARAIADRVIFMDSGRICEIGEPQTFFTSPQTPRAQQFLNQFIHN